MNYRDPIVLFCALTLLAPAVGLADDRGTITERQKRQSGTTPQDHTSGSPQLAPRSKAQEEAILAYERSKTPLPASVAWACLVFASVVLSVAVAYLYFRCFRFLAKFGKGPSKVAEMNPEARERGPLST